MRFRKLIYIAWCFAFFISPACAQQKTALWAQARFSPDAKAFYDAASAVSVPQGADVLVLSEETSYIFDSDGKAQITRYLAYKILTPKGVSQWDSTELNYQPWIESKPTIKVRIITPDYVVHDLDQKTVTDSAAKDDEDTYGDSRVVRAPFPAIAPGSVVEEEDVNTERPTFPGSGMNVRIFPGRGVPVAHAVIVLDAPASLPLRFAARPLDSVRPEPVELNGRVQITFNFDSLEPLEDADPNLPSEVSPFPEVLFSTAASWKDVAASYNKIVDEKLASPEVKPLVARIIDGKTSRDQRLDAIIRYLAKEIRYTGVEFGDAAVVPHTPAETLKQKYGDCKDKSTLLVAMLRSADIPAYVALLNVGRREDVVKDLPGMGRFDHAIVFVPGSPDLWIDATDEYARVGQLPASDQGRLALIARPETDSPVLTAVPASKDNVALEERRFVLSENGPARVIETNRPLGTIESEFRSYYANQEEKDFKKGLTDYVKNQYLSDKLDRAVHSDPADLTKPFDLVVEASKAKRGFTELDNAVVAIRIDSIFQRLPNDLLEKPDDEEKSTDSNKEKPKKPRTADYQLSEPFVTEWHYTVQPPLGFRPKPLPANAEIRVGPALLTENFSTAADGAVSAVLRFDTVQRRFTAAEIKELRKKVADLRDSEPIMIYFEPLAQALMAQGKPREAFQSYRDLINQHPKEAVHHLQKALALLHAGLGGAARAEAVAATKLEPSSALAQKTLAQILETDLVGRKVERGADFSSAVAAFRAAKKLDPEDHEIPGDLAILLEYNNEGERYGSGSRLEEAIAEYRSLTPEQLNNIGLKGNLPYTLFYAGKYDEARKAAEELNPQRQSIIVASEAALHDGAVGLAEARRRTSADEQFKELARNAGQLLLNARLYPQAADLMEAGAAGDNASATLSFAATVRKLQKHESITFKNDPTDFMKKFILLMYDGKWDLSAMRSLFCKNSRSILDKSDPDEIDRSIKATQGIRKSLSRQGTPADVIIDVILQTSETTVEGDDADGYRVVIRVPGSPNLVAYLAKEDGQYKLIDTADTPNAVGQQILDTLAARNSATAKQWLDWVREDFHLAGGDDPLAGSAFPRLWTKGKAGTEGQMKAAATALLILRKETAPQGLPILESALAAATTDSEKLNLTLALLEGYSNLGDSAKTIAICSALETQYPESLHLFLSYGNALRDSRKFSEADALAEARLKILPKDIDALRAEVTTAVAMEDYPLAIERSRKIADLGKAEASDLNTLAWYGLFTGKVESSDVETASKASRMSQNSAAILHTLGALYAEMSKTKEAHDVLLQAMNILNLSEPDSNYWYAFGRIAEDYGESAVARDDYSKVTKPQKDNQIPGSSYRLVQNRMKILDAEANKKN